jgi:hypothetical protein
VSGRALCPNPILVGPGPAREDATLSVGLEALPGFQAAVGRGRQDTAGLWATGIRRLPEMRSAGTWISTGTVRELPRGTPGCFQL